MPIKGNLTAVGIVNVEMEGVEELLQKLKQAGAVINDEQEAAFLAGAKVIENAANRLAPTPDIISEVKESSATSCIVEVKPKEEKWYYRFFETGAGQHDITPKKASALAFEGDEGLVITGGVDHPGMVARPFLRPAFDTEKDAATKAVKDYLEKRLKQLGG
jgi:HK97 gp10 family phage protein